jgi:hypothetical protein
MQNNIESLFVPYQIALDMKSIGFNEPCFGFYYNFGKKFKITTKIKNSNVSAKLSETTSTEFISAPLYQQAFKFFREKFNLLGYVSEATITKGKVYMFCCNKRNDTLFEDIDSDFNTYEEAELECLKKLIEIVKEKK